MLTISLMFWADSACFLVHTLLADPYVRKSKRPSTQLPSWALAEAAAPCSFSAGSILQLRNCPQMCSRDLSSSCWSCTGWKNRNCESYWVFKKGTFTSFLPCLGLSREKWGAGIPCQGVHYAYVVCYRHSWHVLLLSNLLDKGVIYYNSLLLFY